MGMMIKVLIWWYGGDDDADATQAAALLLANTTNAIDSIVNKINSKLHLDIKDHQTVVVFSIVRSDLSKQQNRQLLIFPPALFASFCPCSTWSCAARSGGERGLWRALTRVTFPLLLRMKREQTCEETKTEQSTWVLLWSFSLSGEYLKTLITESSHLNAATHLTNCALANIICQEFSTLLSNELSLYIYIDIYIYSTYKVFTQNAKQTSSKNK